ncbi:MAG: wax ester/triacylglycerol synthase family O-acyltransferase [Actinomycetota bacterium]|nr:wax ester/triacylglycerol synthase family O-acyltransferase [Actinomycetota bacterium]
MRERLSALDASFLYVESPTTAMHVGGLAIFDKPPGGIDFEQLTAHLAGRIAAVPRYRQKVRFVPGRIANPVWVDDAAFDASYHVRRSALPYPGTDAQLHELVARIHARHLDRSRPLWEVYVVEGLSGGRFALLTKTHHAMVDGVSAIDVGELVLDEDPRPLVAHWPSWTAPAEPSGLDLLRETLEEIAKPPASVATGVRADRGPAQQLAERAASSLSGVLAVGRKFSAAAPQSPLNAEIGAARRYATAQGRLEEYKQVRRAHGGTVNDVVLATVAGAVGHWLRTRGEVVTRATTVRAMVPVSVRADGQARQLGNRISAYFVDLPVGEPDPVARLRLAGAAMRRHKTEGQSVGAGTLIAVAGFTPPTLHALAARAVSAYSRAFFNLMVTNVPGPQRPLYAGECRMLEAYPVAPLVKGQAVSIGLTSYDGGMYFGLNGDREAMPDLRVLAAAVEQSFAELRDAVP